MLRDGAWSDWLPLDDRSARGSVPPGSGLYRVRKVGAATLVYVGQTGGLRRRLGQLCSLYGDDMPYSDPHTAAPSLWVMRTVEGTTFEFSVAELVGEAPILKAAECVVIARHRMEHRCSPAANFGRMPAGWIKSTGNNASLVRAGRRTRGFPNPDAVRSTDRPPVLDALRSPTAADWAGLAWSSWTTSLVDAPRRGVYRIRRPNADHLLYIGQGLVAARLAAHAAKSRRDGHRQQAAFTGVLEYSWSELPDCSSTQLQEVECDLIASHVLVTGMPPSAQFLG